MTIPVLRPAQATLEMPQALIPVLVSVFMLRPFLFCSSRVSPDSSDDVSQVEDNLTRKKRGKSKRCKALAS